MQNIKEAPIGVFDSGVGGISVLRELVRLMPNERFLYFGDSANAPYGSRTTEAVRQLTLAAAKKLTSEYPIKALVIACNTATAASVAMLRSDFSLPFVGMEPAIKPAAAKRIAAKRDNSFFIFLLIFWKIFTSTHLAF